MPDFQAFIPATLPRDYLQGQAGAEQLIAVDSTRGPIRADRTAGVSGSPVFGVTIGSAAALPHALYSSVSTVDGIVGASTTNHAGYAGHSSENGPALGDEMDGIVYGDAVGGSFLGQSQNRMAVYNTNAVGGLGVGTFVARGVFFGANNLLSFSLDATLSHLMMARRFEAAWGDDVAVASPLVLGALGNAFLITAAGSVANIDPTGWQRGSRVVLYIDDAVTLTNAAGGSGQLFLAQALDFDMTGGDRIELQYDTSFDAWFELCRTTAGP